MKTEKTKKIQISQVSLIMFVYLFIGAQNICHSLEFCAADPVPGFSPTRWRSFNYVTSDARFMLFQVYDGGWRINSSTWDANSQQWTPPEDLTTDPTGGFPNGTMVASLSPDGMTMYYGYEGKPNYVCRSLWTPNGWTLPPEIVDPCLDPAPSDTYFNGKYFYTTHFYNDIWVSTYDDVNERFSPSIPVDSINTSEWSENGAWISSDSTLLIFSSNQPGGYGYYDLYSATWDEYSGMWTNITNLGPNVNTASDEICSCMAEEAGILFFERRDPNTDERQPMHAFIESFVYHVDGVSGDNTNDGLTRETAFKTIQRGINVAEDYDTVLVWPGVYNEEVAFWGDAITVRSAADAAIVETDYGYAFSFFSAEGPDTVLSNFIIRNSQYGIYLVNGASPTLSNLTIVNNDFGISAFNGADPDISSCILWNNLYGDLFREPVPLQAEYSFVQEEIEDGLVAHWKLDGDANDSAGNNDGTIYGAVPATGIDGTAYEFDDSDYIDTNLIPPIYATASLWIYPKADITGGFMGTGYTTDGGKDGWTWAYISSDDRAAIDFWKGNTRLSDIDTPSGSVPPSQWSLITVVVNDINISVYINGEFSTTGTLSSSPSVHDRGLMIGRNYQIGAGAHTMEGLIDEVRIYDRALSVGEIEAMYEAGMAGLSYGEPGFVDANGGDYHLLSERGRYWPAHDVWVLDDVTSPCIDGGDPNVSPFNERMPNGGRINMGAYGNTSYASMSEWPIKGDVNNDGRFNFMDIAILLDGWLEQLPWAE